MAINDHKFDCNVMKMEDHEERLKRTQSVISIDKWSVVRGSENSQEDHQVNILINMIHDKLFLIKFSNKHAEETFVPKIKKKRKRFQKVEEQKPKVLTDMDLLRMFLHVHLEYINEELDVHLDSVAKEGNDSDKNSQANTLINNSLEIEDL